MVYYKLNLHIVSNVRGSGRRRAASCNHFQNSMARNLANFPELFTKYMQNKWGFRIFSSLTSLKFIYRQVIGRDDFYFVQRYLAKLSRHRSSVCDLFSDPTYNFRCEDVSAVHICICIMYHPTNPSHKSEFMYKDSYQTTGISRRHGDCEQFQPTCIPWSWAGFS